MRPVRIGRNGNPSMISVQNLSKSYGDFLAVEDVSFQISKKEIVGLLGHNGAGKTTIMKMVTGFLEPDQGTINVAGIDIAEQRSLVQSKIGYLPENCPVYLEMTVIEYLEYAAALRGLSRNDGIEAIRYAIDSAELAEKASQPISTLSRGYRQRVGVAQAILTKPEVLILDEPTNGLDPSQILHMRNLITELGEQATIIISTHILQEVQVVCDRVLILREGKLALDSTLEKLNRGQRLLLTIDRGPEEVHSELSAIDGIQSVDIISKQNGQFNYALHVKPKNEQILSEAIPPIAKAIINQGYSLYALYPEIRDLETVFNQINSDQATVEEGGNSRAA